MTKLENHQNYNCVVTTDTGEQYSVYANWLHNNQLDNFFDWNCEAGITRLYIDKNLDVYSGECQNNYLGTIDNFEPLTGNKCQRTRCTGCTDDLIVTKSL